MTDKDFDLGGVFAATTQRMLSNFKRVRAATKHPGTKGDSFEDEWLQTIGDFLPRRYAVNRAQVVDCEGSLSDQIDLVIHDRHFSPTFLADADQVWVPAEAVLAVFEIKPELHKDHIEYAGAKVASVRRLKRTSGAIKQLAQPDGPAPMSTIIGGLLTATSNWKRSFGKPFRNALGNLGSEGHLDIGCTLNAGMWEVRDQAHPDAITHAGPEVGLALFALRLVARLNSFGTVPALDFDRYTAGLLEEPPEESLSS